MLNSQAAFQHLLLPSLEEPAVVQSGPSASRGRDHPLSHPSYHSLLLSLTGVHTHIATVLLSAASAFCC